MLSDNSVASCHWWRAWGEGEGNGVEPTLICGQKQNEEKQREDGGGGEEGKSKGRDGGKNRGEGGAEDGRKRRNNGTTSDSHWNITTQRETSIRKNGLI